MSYLPPHGGFRHFVFPTLRLLGVFGSSESFDAFKGGSYAGQ